MALIHHLVSDARDALKHLGFPSRQQNIRSALTLLALLDLKPGDRWGDAKNPLCGITPMMEFFAKHYGKRYAPNSRETVRRQTVHQFLQASLIEENPDWPDRPTNSGKTVYQITNDSLALLQRYGSESWERRLEAYLLKRPTQRDGTTYRKRDRAVSVAVSQSRTIWLSAGRHNVLVSDIFSKFVHKFIKDPVTIYVGDTAKKFALFEKDMLADLGVAVNPHGKMPDVIIYDEEMEWLFVIEAVTTHGPVDAKRMNELRRMFSGAETGVVYVTAFADMHSMRKYVAEISWGTEVWVADNPDHMIHFDGERFLGPEDPQRDA